MSLNLNVYKRIKDLNSKTTLANDDVLVSDNASENSSTKITFANLCTQLLSKLKIGTLSTSGHYISGTSVAQDLTNLDNQLYTTDASATNKVADVSYTNTGILQKTINNQASNVMTTDSSPTQSSVNPLQSGGAYTALAGKYEKPSGGIPKSDLAESVQDSLDDADSAYQKPEGGIPSTDLASAVQTSLGKADTSVQYISQTLTDTQKSQARSNISAASAIGLATVAENLAYIYSASSTYAVGDYCLHNSVFYRCTTAITTAEAWTSAHWSQVTVAEEIESIGFHDMIKVTLPGITSLNKTFTVTGMTANHELIQDGFALVEPESSMGSNWTLVPGSGTVQVQGTFSGSTSTTITATFGIPDNKVTGVAQ